MIVTLGNTAPANAIRLFNGQDLTGWTTRKGEAPGWTVDADGVLHVVPGVSPEIEFDDLDALDVL